MPAAKFDYRPAPGYLTFGQMAADIVSMNYNYCAIVSHVQAPRTAAGAEDKKALEADMSASFEFCKTALATVDDSKLNDVVFSGQKGQGMRVLMTLEYTWSTDCTLALLYLKLNGLPEPDVIKISGSWFPRTVPTALARDMRSVYDTASLRFKDFSVGGKPDWAVATISPAVGSGSATILGAYLKAETGELVTPPNTQEVVIKKGSWSVVASALPTQRKSGSYSWSRPAGIPLYRGKQRPSPDDYYSPFSYSQLGKADTVIFHFDSAASDMKQFVSVRLLFQDWVRDVEPAFRFISMHPGLLEGGQSGASESAKLRDVLSGTNRLLAVEAFRELIEARQMRPEMAKEQVRQSQGDLDAVFCYLILAIAAEEDLSQSVNDIVRESDDPAKLRSLALGAYTAWVMGPAGAAPDRAKRALRAVAARLGELNGVSLDSDPYLKLILAQTEVL